MFEKLKQLFSNEDKPVVVNADTHTLRRDMGGPIGVSHNGKRSLNDIYGYPDGIRVPFQDLYQMARRTSGIANRLTFGTARTCWREGFEVFDSAEEDANQLLVDEIAKLNKKGLVNKIERADILNRIGAFSVLFVGIPDGREPNEPVGRVSGDGFKSIYFKAFAYDGIEISKFVQDPKDERFGLPELYTVQKQSRGDTNKDIAQSSMVVHWSRIIHMSEMSLDSDTEGMGYLEPIYNRLLDLNKTMGGSAEAYFRNAKGKIGYEVDPEFSKALSDQSIKDALDDGAKKYTNEYQDHTFAVGSKLKTLPTPHASPKDTVMVGLWEVSGYSGYPIRILTGEGSGQLAGSEDQLALNAIISDRQSTVCSPWVIVLFEMLAKAGMLDWDDNWIVKFPKQSTVTEAQQADVDNKKADTLLKTTQAKSQIGGDEVVLESALEEFGLGDIELDEINDDDRGLEDDDQG